MRPRSGWRSGKNQMRPSRTTQPASRKRWPSVRGDRRAVRERRAHLLGSGALVVVRTPRLVHAVRVEPHCLPAIDLARAMFGRQQQLTRRPAVDGARHAAVRREIGERDAAHLADQHALLQVRVPQELLAHADRALDEVRRARRCAAHCDGGSRGCVGGGKGGAGRARALGSSRPLARGRDRLVRRCRRPGSPLELELALVRRAGQDGGCGRLFSPLEALQRETASAGLPLQIRRSRSLLCQRIGSSCCAAAAAAAGLVVSARAPPSDRHLGPWRLGGCGAAAAASTAAASTAATSTAAAFGAVRSAAISLDCNVAPACVCRLRADVVKFDDGACCWRAATAATADAADAAAGRRAHLEHVRRTPQRHQAGCSEVARLRLLCSPCGAFCRLSFACSRSLSWLSMRRPGKRGGL